MLWTQAAERRWLWYRMLPEEVPWPRSPEGSISISASLGSAMRRSWALTPSDGATVATGPPWRSGHSPALPWPHGPLRQRRPGRAWPVLANGEPSSRLPSGHPKRLPPAGEVDRPASGGQEEDAAVVMRGSRRRTRGSAACNFYAPPCSVIFSSRARLVTAIIVSSGRPDTAAE